MTTRTIEAFADSAFAEYLRFSAEPSLALVVVKDGAVIFARGFGTEDGAATRPVDPDRTVFWMASLSKLVTADAVMREVDRGRITLDAPAPEYLGFPLPSRSSWRPITVRDLLTHTAGLDEPFMQGTVDEPGRLVSLGDYLARLHWRAGTPPGDVLRYSNHGMALAGRIVERTSGVPFADFVDREIFAPLGMSHSTFRQPVPAELARRIATAGTAAASDFLLATPAGAMAGTPNDMGRFLIAQLDSLGPHAAALRTMHATQWRAHPSVPGVGLGWFETELGGVRALYHTGARYQFSVAWIAPSRGVGLFLVHSMRQGGRFQDLRTEVVRAFAQRFFVPDVVRHPATPVAPSWAGVYRPALLSTTTVERAGNLFLDTPVRLGTPLTVTIRAPGGLGSVVGRSVGDDAFEVREGPHAGLRVGFVRVPGRSQRMAMGGTLLDPVVFTRLSWWQRGVVHGALLLAACATIVTAAGARAARRRLRRRHGAAAPMDAAWVIVFVAAGSLILAPLIVIVTLATNPEVGAADHMRAGIRVGMLFLTLAAVACVLLPLSTVTTWARAGRTRMERGILTVLSIAGIAVTVLMWHYRLIGATP